MGDYCLHTDVEAELTELTVARLTAATGSTPDDTVTDEQIDLSETEINGHLAVRYSVPVDVAVAHLDAADQLKRLTLALVVYRLYSRKRVQVPSVTADRAAAIEELKAIAAGTMELGTASTPDSTTAREPTSSWSSQTAITGRSNMVGL